MIPPPASFAALAARAEAGGRLDAVFLGGSLTWGANASDPQRTSWRALMGGHLAARFPRAQVHCHDAAIGGTGSRLALFRLERDVLARRPDLVFLDCTVNDDAAGTDGGALASYEGVLRALVQAGIPVVQVLLAVRRMYRPDGGLVDLPRYRAHLALAAAYGTAVGDAIAGIGDIIAADPGAAERLWPFPGDPTHPDDEGYRAYFLAVRDGLEAALARGLACAAPAAPVHPGCLRDVRRRRLLDGPLPAGWRRERAARTAVGMGFDGTPSRWLDGVAVAGGDAAPLRLRCDGTFLAVLGEADQDCLPFTVRVDGRTLLAPDGGEAWRTAQQQAARGSAEGAVRGREAPGAETAPGTAGAGAGEAGAPADGGRSRDKTSWAEGGRFRILLWRVLSEALRPGAHEVEIAPLPGRGTLRLESVCCAGPG